jgi:hypothetical protein
VKELAILEHSCERQKWGWPREQSDVRLIWRAIALQLKLERFMQHLILSVYWRESNQIAALKSDPFDVLISIATVIFREPLTQCQVSH